MGKEKKEKKEEQSENKKDKNKDNREKTKNNITKSKISRYVYENILIAVAIMIYFILINFTYLRIDEEILSIVLKIFSGIILILSLILIEIAYKRDSGKIAINGLELLVLAGYTLSITHVVQVAQVSFTDYILISSYSFSTYYLLKAVIVFTKERREYLKSFNDIHEIVKNEPIKKEAKKKNK